MSTIRIDTKLSGPPPVASSSKSSSSPRRGPPCPSLGTVGHPCPPCHVSRERLVLKNICADIRNTAMPLLRSARLLLSHPVHFGRAHYVFSSRFRLVLVGIITSLQGGWLSGIGEISPGRQFIKPGCSVIPVILADCETKRPARPTPTPQASARSEATGPGGRRPTPGPTPA